MKKIDKDNIPNELMSGSLYLYGAGYTARICIEALEKSHIKIEALIDDDMMKWNTKVYDAVYQYYLTENINELVKVCTTEESYFIKEVKDYFRNRTFTLVDAGAYMGELLRAIVAAGLNVSKWYCFEVDKDNYIRLKDNIEKNILPKGMECIYENYGLWSEQKELPVIAQGVASKVMEGKIKGACTLCKMETIDSYFKNLKVDMIKMDIEGAEMEALRGAVNTIKRDRPLIAVSIYHYVKDYYRIMQFLLKVTGGGYKWYIRQHAMIYGETVLYAIPCRNEA